MWQQDHPQSSTAGAEPVPSLRRWHGQGEGLRRTGATREEAPEHSMDPRASDEPPYRPTVINNTIYQDGKAVDNPGSLADAFERLKQMPGALAWIGLYRPKEWELVKLAEEFELHELAVEDAIVAHQRPKLERYGDTLFVVLRAARYLDDVEEVEFGEVHVFVGPNFVLTVRHAEAPGPPGGAQAHGVRPRPAPPGPPGGAVRHPGRRRRRLRAGRGRAAEGHRGDRGPGVRRRPVGLPPRLRAVRRGHRVPARHRAAGAADRRVHRRRREVRPQRGVAELPAGRGRPRHHGHRAGGLLPPATPGHPGR